MCEPATLGTIGMAMNLGGAGQSAGASRQEGEYLQGVANRNAATLDEAATDAQARGAKEASYQRMKTTAGIEDARAAYGASGVDGTVGTPLRQAGDARMIGEFDAQTIRANAAREAWGYKVEAERTREEGRVAQLRGRNAAFGTLLGGASNFVGGLSDGYARGRR